METETDRAPHWPGLGDAAHLQLAGPGRSPWADAAGPWLLTGAGAVSLVRRLLRR